MIRIAPANETAIIANAEKLISKNITAKYRSVPRHEGPFFAEIPLITPSVVRIRPGANISSMFSAAVP